MYIIYMIPGLMMVAAAQEPVVSPIGTLRKIPEFLMQNGNLKALARLDIPCSVPAVSHSNPFTEQRLASPVLGTDGVYASCRSCGMR